MLKSNVELLYPKKFVWYKLSKVFLCIFTISLIFLNNGWASFMLWASFFILIPYAIYVYLNYSNTSLYFDNDKIIKRFGIITKKSVIIQFDKVQNISLRSGLLMRLFDISFMGIWTASQSQMIFKKDGGFVNPEIGLILDSIEAEELRLFIMNKERNAGI